MTDIEENDSTDWEKVLSDFAKLRASLKTKYEWEINSLKKEIEQLKWQRFEDKKTFLRSSLNQQGYKLDDFDEFAEKYWNLDSDEMEALYRGMHWTVEQPVVTEQTKTIWPRSVIWTNPSLDWEEKRPEDMSLDEYYQYAQSLIQ